MTCDKCKGKGVIFTVVNGNDYVQDCECLIAKRSYERLEKSGLKELADRYTLDRFKTLNAFQKHIKNTATEFLDSDNWFYIGGQVGAGKTHICTAISLELINKGNNLKYMLWRDEIVKLKASVTDAEQYDKHIRALTDVKILYIDDMFKGSISEADINIAFQIINNRYNANKQTIISSEKTIMQIKEIDEAISSRITEKAGHFLINIQKDNLKNYRERIEK